MCTLLQIHLHVCLGFLEQKHSSPKCIILEHKMCSKEHLFKSVTYHLAKGDGALDKKIETSRITYLVLFIHNKRPQVLFKFTYKFQLLHTQ